MQSTHAGKMTEKYVDPNLIAESKISDIKS